MNIDSEAINWGSYFICPLNLEPLTPHKADINSNHRTTLPTDLLLRSSSIVSINQSINQSISQSVSQIFVYWRRKHPSAHDTDSVERKQLERNYRVALLTDNNLQVKDAKPVLFRAQRLLIIIVISVLHINKLLLCIL